MSLPSQHRAVVVSKGEGKPGAAWHPIAVKSQPLPQTTESQVLLKVHAAAFNHRDVWIRKGAYPGIAFDSVLGSDCSGTVVSPSSSPLVGKKVIPYPAVGWEEDIRGPDVSGQEFGILGGMRQTQGRGTFGEYVAVEERYCVPLPEHLTVEQGAALPLGGLTAWRAVVTKGKVTKGMNVLVTGAGGGVALQAVQFAKALGAKVWVTSGSKEKIEEAKKLGAEGGVSYKDADWPKQLAALLPKSQPLLDVVIDSAGGDIMQKCNRIMRLGGVFVVYGSTTGASIPATMPDVLKNIDLLLSTMGSVVEFKAMVAFVAEKRLVPVVWKVYNGLDQVTDGFDAMRNGEQFGKIVVKVSSEAKKGKL